MAAAVVEVMVVVAVVAVVVAVVMLPVVMANHRPGTYPMYHSTRQCTNTRRRRATSF